MQVNLSKMPKPQQTYVVDFPRLDGGLNLKELSYRLDPDESPNMKNLWWQDGVLQCRDGQRFIADAAPVLSGPSTDDYGYACTQKPFFGYMFFHIGQCVYYAPYPVSPAVSKRFGPFVPIDFELEPVMADPDPRAASLFDVPLFVEQKRGVFFEYGDDLYYKNEGGFYQISRTYDDEDQPFTGRNLERWSYVPTILINADPTVRGAGDAYQPENRLSYAKKVTYNAQSGVTDYLLPVTGVTRESDLPFCEVMVDGVRMVEGTQANPQDYWVDATTGTVHFTTAPAVTDPPTNNTVVIQYEKEDDDARAALNSVMDCTCAVTAGNGNHLCILLAGCPEQRNAVFWNANDSVGMNPSYFPMTNYNFCGDSDESVTGFGKQYDDLILFKENSIGKLEFEITSVDERDSILFKYQLINDRIGCDLPYTIQLVENNLVFCNTHRGVHMLMSSSAAYENNVVCISEKVNGSRDYGLLYDVRRDDGVVSRGVNYYALEDGQYVLKGTTDNFYDVTPHTSSYGKIYIGNKPYYVPASEVRNQTVTAIDDDSRYWLCAAGHVYLWDYSISKASDPSWFYLANIHGIAYVLDNDGRLYHLDPWGRVTMFERSFVDYPVETEPGSDEQTGIPIVKVYAFPAQHFGSYDRLKDVLSILVSVRSDTDTTTKLLYETDYGGRVDLTPIESFSWQFVPRNLRRRCLSVSRYARVQRRTPGCRHIRHFALTLGNDGIFEDLAIISLQIFYRYQGKER